MNAEKKAWMCTHRENMRKMMGALISDGLGSYFPDWMWQELFELFTAE